MKVSSITMGQSVPFRALVFKGKSEKEENKQNQTPSQAPAADDRLWLAVMALAGIKTNQKEALTESDKEQVLKTLTEGKSSLQKTSYDTAKSFYEMKYSRLNPTLSKHVQDCHGIPLLVQNNALNRNGERYKKAIDTIRNIGFEKLTSTEELPVITAKNPAIWSVTSEFAPVKEGGLGSVPPEIRNNVTRLGIDVPTFVPMYLDEGHSTYSEMYGKYRYSYKGKEFELEPVMSFKLDTYKNSQMQSVPIDIFLSRDKDAQGNERKLIFIKCDKYFDGTIYEQNAKTEEPEKFAIMSKAVYELAKIKADGIKASKDTKIYSTSALESIKAPDAMILNDWQASPIAALMRYKSSMENAYGQLSDGSTEKLKNMPIITIGHNVTYQGSVQNHNTPEQKKQSSTNILNTLFDKYTYDIVSNASIHSERFDDEGAGYFDNPLLLNQEDENDNYTNFLNMGIVLSDYFSPVSQNYAQELITPDRKDLSRNLQWVLTQKAKAGKLVGIINGNDFNNLSIKAKAKDMKKLTGIDLRLYDKQTPIDELMQIRQENKINLYNNFILPFTESKASSAEDIKRAQTCSSRLEFCKGERGTQLPILSDEELKNTPILTSGGRLVTQKGMGVLTEAIEILFDNWDKDFPNRPKPIFYLAGQDGQGGSQRKLIEDMKDLHLSKEDSDRVLFAHGFVPMPAMMASSDFFLMPSIFEPCGLTQGESFAVSTPVIASAVGGIVDTVNRNGKHNGVLTDKTKRLDAQEFYKAMKEALTIYFEDKDEYKTMVADSIAEDFSWVQKGKQGPVYDYLDIIGLKRENISDVE